MSPHTRPDQDALATARQAAIAVADEPRVAQEAAAPATFVAPVASLRRSDAGVAGWRSAMLGEVQAAGVDVPVGFAVLAPAFGRFLASTGLRRAIAAALQPLEGATASGGQPEPAAFEHASRQVRAAIMAATVPVNVVSAIQDAYVGLCRQVPGATADDVGVDLHLDLHLSPSSDLVQAEWAAARASSSNVRGAEPVVERVKACWADAYASRLLYRRAQHGGVSKDLAVAVAVQRTLATDSSGTCRTAAPGAGDPSRIVVEATWGAALSAAARPDRFVVDRQSFTILERQLVRKLVERVLRPDRGIFLEQAVHPSRQLAPSLTDEEVSRLAQTAALIESRLGHPVALDFAVEFLRERRIRIVNARPALSGLPAP